MGLVSSSWRTLSQALCIRDTMKKIFGFITSLLLSTTSIAQEQVDFKVDVPQSWKLVTYSESEKLWVYESNNRNHRLTVSILYYSEEANHAQQGQFLEEYLVTRKEQSSKIAPGLTFSEVELKEYETAWVSKFNEASINGRLTTNKAISSRIGIANFYFESFSSHATHEEVSSKILSTTGFAS